MGAFVGQQLFAATHIIIARHNHRRITAFHGNKLTVHRAAKVRAAATGRFVPGIKPRRALVPKPHRAMMRMIVPFALAFLHRECPRHLIAARPNHRPQKRLVRLPDHVTRKQLAVIIHRDAGLRFLHRKCRRLGMDSQQGGKSQEGKKRFHADAKPAGASANAQAVFNQALDLTGDLMSAIHRWAGMMRA